MADERAFRSLIETVTKNDPKSNLSPEAITRLTEKLGEIVGYDTMKDLDPGKRNERGELVNEEGLPIIDITEPAPDSDSSNFALYEPLVPLEEIPTSERKRLRQQRDRVLDALEAEERQEEEKVRQKERDEYEELVRKRENSPAGGMERAKRAKELQKKMGKALLRNMAESNEQEQRRIKDEQDSKKKIDSPSKKKNVTFVDEPDLLAPKNDFDDWGDVTPGRILPMKRPSLLTENSSSQTMQMNVVERHPVRVVRLPKSTAPEKDSDDESDDAIQSSSEGYLSPPEYPEMSSDEQQSDFELEEETDIHFASLQREILLEYHQKRSIIGQEAASLIQTPPEPVNEDNPGGELAFAKGEAAKPAISQYRASRLVSAYGASNPASASSFVVPAASAQTLRSAIRMGGLDTAGNLVGGEDDSGSEAEDGTMQEVLELLTNGEVYNIGPNGESIHVLPQTTPSPSSSYAKKPTATFSALRLDETKTLPPLTTKSPMSKFKVSRLAVDRTPASAETHSESATPINHLERSSPKGVTPSLSPSDLAPTFAPPPAGSSTNASMIVESPSFPRRTVTKESSSAPFPAANPSWVVERKTSRPDRPPTVIASTVMEVQPARKPTVPQEPSTELPKKVSRFKRDRMP